MTLRRSIPILFAISISACSAEAPETEPTATVSSESVGGCACPTTGKCSDITYTDIPADGKYYVTTFGGGADTQGMACGGTADGTWAYIADSSRFGCGAKVLVEANGKSCVTQVGDCGPNRCVEEAACYCSCGNHHPIIDASPYITKYLLGTSSAGWSDKIIVTATPVDDASEVGCPGSVSGSGGSGGISGSGGGAGVASGGQAGSTPSGGAGGTGGSGAQSTGGSGGVVSGGGGANAKCVPGQQVQCSCSPGSKGVQICASDGSKFGPCSSCKKSSSDDGGCGCRFVVPLAPTKSALVVVALALISLRRARTRRKRAQRV
jgi:hypothetical protein